MIWMIKLIILDWQGQPESSLPTISKMNQHLIKAVDQLQFVHYEQNSMVCHTSKSEGPSAEPRSIVHLMVKKKDLTKIFLPTSFYQLFIAFTAVLSYIIQFSHWALDFSDWQWSDLTPIGSLESWRLTTCMPPPSPPPNSSTSSDKRCVHTMRCVVLVLVQVPGWGEFVVQLDC